MEKFENYIGGKPTPPASGKYFDTENPFTAKPWALVARSNAEDADRAVAAAKSAFEGGDWTDRTASERGALLAKLAALVKANVDMLATAESRDNGKTITETRGQVRNLAEWYQYYAGLADKLNGEVIPTERRNHLNYTRYEPLGVCALIIPWNSPLRLLAWKLAPAVGGRKYGRGEAVRIHFNLGHHLHEADRRGWLSRRSGESRHRLRKRGRRSPRRTPGRCKGSIHRRGGGRYRGL